MTYLGEVVTTLSAWGVAVFKAEHERVWEGDKDTVRILVDCVDLTENAKSALEQDYDLELSNKTEYGACRLIATVNNTKRNANLHKRIEEEAKLREVMEAVEM